MVKKILNRFNLVFLSMFIGFSATVQAQTASITLSEKSAQAAYGFLVGGSNYGRTELKTEFLYNSDETYLLDVSLQVFDEVGSKMKGLVAGLGGKVYGGSINKNAQEILVLGVGGMLRYAVPQNPRFIIGFDAYYAPEIVSFIDAKRFYETAVRAEYEVLPKASAYLEYRKFFLDVDNGGSGSIEDGFRVGMEISF